MSELAKRFMSAVVGGSYVEVWDEEPFEFSDVQVDGGIDFERIAAIAEEFFAAKEVKRWNRLWGSAQKKLADDEPESGAGKK